MLWIPGRPVRLFGIGVLVRMCLMSWRLIVVGPLAGVLWLRELVLRLGLPRRKRLGQVV